jgi:hypothetical protein
MGSTLKQPDTNTRPILVECDYRADMKKNGRVGMVLETPGSSFELRGLYGASPNITAIVRGESSIHKFQRIDEVYVKLDSIGGTFVFRSDGSVDRINKMSPSNPVSTTVLQPRDQKELMEAKLVVGKMLPGIYFPTNYAIKSIVVVPARQYTDAQITAKTGGKTAPFVLEAQRIIDTQEQWG